MINLTDSQYQPNTGHIVDCDNDEETVTFCLIDDGDLLLSRQIVYKDGRPSDSRFLCSMSKATMIALHEAAVKNGVLDEG